MNVAFLKKHCTLFHLFSHCILSFFQSAAQLAVQDMLKEIARKVKSLTGNTKLSAEDFLDDGSKIQLSIDIDESKVVSSLLSKHVVHQFMIINKIQPFIDGDSHLPLSDND